MKVEWVRASGWAMVAVLAMGSAGCASSGRGGAQAQAPRGASAIAAKTAGSRPTPKLDHLIPSRDSMGRAPSRFEWTAVAGAESYSVGIWNEVDRLLWRQNGVTGTSTPRPADLELEPGTYFWTISAVRGGDEIANSGLAAFVVRATP